LAVSEPGDTEPGYVNVHDAVAAVVLGVDFRDEHLSVARTFSDTLNVGGRIARIDWNWLGYRLLPVAESHDSWVVSRYTGAVVASLHVYAKGDIRFEPDGEVGEAE
jgi:hypothetical protein